MQAVGVLGRVDALQEGQGVEAARQREKEMAKDKEYEKEKKVAQPLRGKVRDVTPVLPAG